MSQNASRRTFLLQSSLASLGVMLGGKSALASNFFQSKPNSLIKGVQIGVTTYSYRSMPGHPDLLLQYCIDSNINAVELKGDEVEAYLGKPLSTIKMPKKVAGQSAELSDELKAQIKQYQKDVANWRETISMDKFAALGKKFNAAGVYLFAYKPNCMAPENTDGEINYALNASRALGANSVSVELPSDAAHTQRLGDLAKKAKIYIGYHAHLQATETAWDVALAQSPYNSLNLDCGHYMAAGNTKESLLNLIETKHKRITSMHLKDRKTKANGGKNMPWGEGDTPLKEILTLMKEKKYKMPATIELEYDIPTGSDAVKETKKCRDYAQQLLDA
ncbi:MAG: TIM barrel protein [Bacteroidetes bacterium]|nr:TIM barrel protein [Bacteroidota bacterium]